MRAGANASARTFLFTMKIMRLILLVIAAAFSIGAAQTLVAQTVYDVKGRVYGPDSKPVPNVLVTLENNARAQVAQDTTNTDGRYEFSGIVAGTYYISVKPDETRFQAVFQRIELINTTIGGSGFSTETVDFSLRVVFRPIPVPGTVFAQTVPPDAEKEYLSAVKSLTKGDKELAAKQLARAIGIYPTYFLALQQLGALYVDQTRYEQAIEPLKKAVQVNSKAPQAHLGLGIAYLNLDRPKQSIDELRAAISLDAKLFTVHLYLGMALIAVGDLNAAEKSLKEALAQGGSIPARAAHLYLASIYNTRKQYRLAVDEMETYLRENPKAINAANIQEAIKKLKAKL
jgi:tetratricopeptide (TPR) repeat protein